jgi:hypothetical protein
VERGAIRSCKRLRDGASGGEIKERKETDCTKLHLPPPVIERWGGCDVTATAVLSHSAGSTTGRDEVGKQTSTSTGTGTGTVTTTATRPE